MKNLSLGLTLVLLAGCATKPPPAEPSEAPPQKSGSGYKVGSPYQIDGIWYYPAVDYDYDQTGIASWYGPGFHAKMTANGEIYDENELTAAHKTLPLPSLVRVTNLENGRSIVVRINDRGPFAAGRIIDMSRRGAQLLGFEQQGTAKVRVQVLADESRAIAAAAQSGDATRQVTADGDRAPNASPRPTVQVEGQPLPPASTPTRTVAIPASVQGATAADGRFLPAPVVQQQPVPPGPKQIYVQVGAFARYDNADRLRAKLASIGPSMLSPTMIDGTQYFRVRLGPLASAEQADQILAAVLADGNNGARVVID